MYSIKDVQENLKNYNFHKLYKELLNFCSLDLSSFYFDIRKDTLYCDSLIQKKEKIVHNYFKYNIRLFVKMVCTNICFHN